ncbi:MAG: ATP-dependent helicase [Bacteroides sp.]
MDEIFKDLNEAQIEAVKSTEGRIRVIAGAGSGKTKVLANRYAYLVEKVGIDSSNILCLTFTNKAANEMKSRIQRMVHAGNTNDLICTIHGFCVKVLRKDIFRLGFPKNFRIIDEEDSKSFAKRVMEEMGLERTVETVQQFLKNKSQLKRIQQKSYIPLYFLPNSTINEKAKDDCFARFCQLQLKYYALDFQDLQYFTLHLFKTYPQVLTYWQDQINYLQIDETQDCNDFDWQLIKLLGEKSNNIFVVGDPDQAIYEWRGASPEALLSFQHDKEVILSQNYRSTQSILDVANSIIHYNIHRIKKDLHTNNIGHTITIYHHGCSEQEEGQWISNQILNLIHMGARKSDIAILFRASNLSRFIEQALIKNNISYEIWGGTRFFERKEIKDACAYLHLIADKNDDLSFSRIINVPPRRFGKTSLEKLEELAKKDNISLYVALKKYAKDVFSSKSDIHNFIDIIEDLSLMASMTNSVSEIMEVTLIRTGLKDIYRKDGDEERLENIQELLSSIHFYEQTNQDEDISLDKYLQDIALYTNVDLNNPSEKVKLMTIHQSKGLEFPYIFVIGLTEGIFPNHRSIRERKLNGLEEERRLMYVAVTRAEKALFLTESEGYNFQTKSYKYPSRFIKEIKDDLIKVDGNIDPTLFENTKRIAQQLEDELSNKDTALINCFHIGDNVKHELFGVGEVIEIIKEKASLKVKFSNSEKYVKPSFVLPCYENMEEE